jgi:hypothetical protein
VVFIVSALSYHAALAVLYSRHSGKPRAIIPIWLLAVLGGGFYGIRTGNAPELFLVFVPLLLSVGVTFCFIWEGIVRFGGRISGAMSAKKLASRRATSAA